MGAEGKRVKLWWKKWSIIPLPSLHYSCHNFRTLTDCVAYVSHLYIIIHPPKIGIKDIFRTCNM